MYFSRVLFRSHTIHLNGRGVVPRYLWCPQIGRIPPESPVPSPAARLCLLLPPLVATSPPLPGARFFPGQKRLSAPRRPVASPRPTVAGAGRATTGIALPRLSSARGSRLLSPMR